MSERGLWNFADNGYMRCSVGPVQQEEQHWLACVRIYFVLSGKMQLMIGMKRLSLHADDIVLINKGELFGISDSSAYVAAFDLEVGRLERKLPDLWFDLNADNADDDRQIVILKEFLARFIKFNLDLAQDKSYLNRSLYYAIIHHLLSFFRVEKPPYSVTDTHMLDRVDRISRYINTHYHEPLTLQMLANRFYLSVPYMSKMFKQYFGTTFTAYLSNIRLQSSIPELQRGELTVEEIAGLCGFSDSRGYIGSFRKKYGMTPGEYRRQLRSRESANAARSQEAMDVAHSRQLETLARYLERDEVDAASTDSLPAMLTEIPQCSVRAKAELFTHHYQMLCSIGCASDLLNAENQQMLRTLQKEIGFRYILFHGLLDDDMITCSEANGTPEINFSCIDVAFDFLTSIGLKPFVELSYMPRSLAGPNAQLTNSGRSCIGFPNDMKKWTALVSGLILHLNRRYGRSEVASWPFSLWNLPDSGEHIFGLGSVQDYFAFYEQTFRTVRQCNGEIRFCGPSCLTETMENGDWYPAFLRLCRENGCLPQLLQYHFYPMRQRSLSLDGMRAEPHLAYRTSPNALRESLVHVAKRTAAWTDRRLPFLVTEWNATVSHRELLNDTAFQGAYVAKNALETIGLVDALCYWTLSDSIGELKPSGQLYHGGLGLFTYNGIKKASYHALQLLSKLGSGKLGAGEGWFFSKSEDGVQILLYNYQHYSSLYADGELFDMSFLKRYTPFVNPMRRKFTMSLTDFAPGRYLIKETSVSRLHGSSFDTWVESGAQSLDSPDELEHLRSSSLPWIYKRVVSLPEGKLDLTQMLEPHEVRLIEIKESFGI